MKQHIKRLRDNQQGFASMVVALVMIVVLSLLTLGFAQLARREQQNALFKQLSSQAYYAAESGVNDVVKGVQTGAITDNPANPTDNINTNECLGAPLTTGDKHIIDRTTDVSYTCAMVNLKPPSVRWLGVGEESSRNITFSTTGVRLKEFTVGWSSIDPNKMTPRSSGTTNFATKVSWQSPPVIQFSITPLRDVTRDLITSRTFTAYLYPSAGTAATITYSPGATPPIASGGCTTTGSPQCSVKIVGFDASSVAGEKYLVRIVNYYTRSDISINNVKDANDAAVNISDGQVQIDVTGKAKNVLKRIQIRKTLHPIPDLPAGAIDAQSTCKRFGTYPVSTTAGETVYDAADDASCREVTTRN